MTTNQELRKQAEKAANAYERKGRGDILFTGAQVIELLDRIDRLEAENKILSNNLELAEEAGKELSHQYILRGERLEAARAENEAKDRLLEQAKKSLIRWREKQWPGTDQASVVEREYPNT